MWPLSAIVQAACSDNETDNEDVDVRSKRPVKVRELCWRSSTLESLWVLVEEYKVRIDESIPGTSPGTSGRQHRSRIRSDDRPVSKIEAPTSLPVDCYSQEWLSTLSPLARAQLEIHPTPVLQNFISIVKSYLSR